jgi:RNA polymerase sigma factor (sigma-70 family)
MAARKRFSEIDDPPAKHQPAHHQPANDRAVDPGRGTGDARLRVSDAYRQHAGELQRYLTRKLRCAETAEDITQDLFIRLFRIGDLSHVKELRPYLYRMAENLLIDHYRSAWAKFQYRHAVSLDHVENLGDDRANSEDMVVLRDQLQRVVTIVDELPDSCGRIFWLSRAQGYCNFEIAEQLGICLSTVEKNVNRATRHCQSRLGKTEQFASCN